MNKEGLKPVSKAPQPTNRVFNFKNTSNNNSNSSIILMGSSQDARIDAPPRASQIPKDSLDERKFWNFFLLEFLNFFDFFLEFFKINFLN